MRLRFNAAREIGSFDPRTRPRDAHPAIATGRRPAWGDKQETGVE
jgi:hypothetical protein